MKFTFEKTSDSRTRDWEKTTRKLMEDLENIARHDEDITSEEAVAYATDALNAVEEFINRRGDRFLFLMYAAPDTMPGDCRTEYVYKPTYIICTTLMTLANRYDEIWDIPEFKEKMSTLLASSTGRKFLGSGYDEYDGLLETLRIFATGDTLEFIQNNPEMSSEFTVQLFEALEFLKDGLCTGKAKHAWGGDYSQKANAVREMLRI